MTTNRFKGNDMLKRLIPALAILGAAVLPALAHHAPVMFDLDKEVTLSGTVKSFRYANPHSSIKVMVPREGGPAVEWNIETVSPLVLDRAGIDPDALQPGDEV